MADTTTQDTASSQYFEPRNTDELWDLVTSPHPVVGRARHLGEALINAGMLQPTDLMQSLRMQQSERDRGRQLGEASDVALAVRAIADGMLDYSTGQVLNVDGGFHLRSL